MKRLLVVLCVALLSVACGDDSNGGSGGSGGSDGLGGTGGTGGTSGTGTGGTGGSASGIGLEINGALGIAVTDPQWGEMTNVRGALLVTRDNEETEATVTVNGVEFQQDFTKVAYGAPDGTQVPNAGAGKTLVIEAEDSIASTSMELPCPGGIEITSPAQGTSVRAGDEITLTWTGDVFVSDIGFFFTPRARFFEPTGDDTRWIPVGDQIDLPEGANSVTVTVPEDGWDKLILALEVPGDFINEPTKEGGSNAGVCWLQRWVELEL